MNSSTRLSQPRVLCRAVRAWASFADAAGCRHAAACADCQEYFRACAALEDSLRLGATEARREPPSGLENRILHAVSVIRIQPMPKRFPIRLVARAALAATLALAGVAGVQFLRKAPRDGSTANAGSHHEEIAVILQTAETLSDRWWNSVVPAATTFVHDNALRQELDSVVAGAQSALDFLALNFLPTHSANEAVTPTNPSARERRI